MKHVYVPAMLIEWLSRFARQMSGVAEWKTRLMVCVKHEDVIQYRPDILQNSKKTPKQL
jgi:hypothetical protein